MKKNIAGVVLLGMVSAASADVTLISDDFSLSSITGSARIYLNQAGDGSGNDWIARIGSNWTVSDGALTNSAITTDNYSEGAMGQVYTVNTTDTSLTKVRISFDYTVGVGSTLYFFANGLTTNGAPAADAQLYNTMATAGNPQDIADGNEFADISILTGLDPVNNGSGISIAGGASGTFDQTFTLTDYSWSADEAPGVSGSLANITDLDYLVTMFGVNVTVTDGTGAVSIDNFNVTAIPEPATLGFIGVAGLGLIFIRRRVQI